MAYQSLYRRYRPQTFGEIRGQAHVVAALRNAVAKGEVGHAYLLHGPRGTGKTTTARVLAKALNCENLGADGEPCGACESCVAIEQGRSFDLHELDAASNNKVDDMRDLLAKVNLGTPGRAKVYLLDEVHMLTPGAENALLKTLEEPPEHVIWALATTEPHKVVETIRSRCQVFELGLLSADEMAEHVRWVVADAGLEVDDTAIDHVVAAGGGSVRDTLSALDRVVAAGGVVELDASTDALLDALASRDSAAALAAVGDATGRGRDPRTIGESALAGLRDAFLVVMGSPPPRLAEHDLARATELGKRFSPAQLTRALETIGTALVEMRQAPDPRVDLEVALVRLCRPDTDRSVDALVERVERLERQLASGDLPAAAPAPEAATPPAAPRAGTAAPAPAPPPVGESSTPAPPPPAAAEPPAPEPARADGPAAAARRALAEKRERSASARPGRASATPPPAAAPPTPPTATPPPAPAPPSTPAPDADDGGLGELRPTSPKEVVALAAEHLGLDRDEVVARANELLGPSDGPRSPEDLTRLWLDLIVGGTAPKAPPPQPPTPAPSDDPGPPDDPVDLDDLVDAPDHADQLIEQLTEAFPGAELQTPAEDPDGA